MKFMHATIHFTAATHGASRCGVGLPWGHFLFKIVLNREAVHVGQKKGKHPHSPDRRIRATLPNSYLGCWSGWVSEKREEA